MEEKSSKRKILIGLSILISVLLLNQICLGDVIILKSGEVIKGKVVSKQGNTITFKTDDGRVLTLKDEQIAAMEFISDKVVEVQINGQKIKGVEVGRTKDSVIVKTAFGEKILKAYDVRELKDSSYKSENIIYSTNYHNITNETTNFITNYVFLTNYIFITNYVENFLTNLEGTTQQLPKNNLRLSVNLNISYAFENLYIGYKAGIGFRLFENGHLHFNLGKLWDGFVAEYRFGYELFEWFSITVGIGGFFSSSSSYVLTAGSSLALKSSILELSIPLEIHFISSNFIPSLGVSIKF
ncbi:MAG: hypothetical protein RMJ37_07110 [Spirochaetia bacterium]|nr:hypothetical protein [Spirochaetota bacterium]MDW8113084.1 hypothetical protein [Spirochaetia bacterium]